MEQKDNIEKVMHTSYLTYAMSVIVSRALPDIRDGLKPVHRRLLYSMYELGNFHNRPYKKSARVVGEVLGKYHPHGDAAIYDSLVRMAQDFSLRYVVVDGQGNFGSIDGDMPAAMRYTEVRMKKLAEEMLQDIEKETVDFRPNFDNTLQEPLVLPSKVPNLLINGSSGIAVGMATNIPPHNINEVIDALVSLIEGGKNVHEIIQGPDFPTGGIVLGKSGIMKAYMEGRGIIKLRAKAEVKDDLILIHEIPYQVQKSRIIEEIVEVVKNSKIDGIADLHDRSDKRGLLIEIRVKRNFDPNIILNKLFEFTSLEISFGIINICLVNGVPKLMSLEQMLIEFLKFRFEVIRRRTAYLKRKAEERRHIVIGIIKAISKIDETIEVIKKSKDYQKAVESLIELLDVDEIQAKSILDIRLQKLISTETEKLQQEKEDLDKAIGEYEYILLNDEKVYEIIKRELIELKDKYSDPRRTQIIDSYEERDEEDLIPDKEFIVTYSSDQYIKRVELEELKVQARGGKGIQLVGSDKVLTAKNHDTLLVFTNKGRVYGLKVYELPKLSRSSKGRHIKALLKLMDDEYPISLLPIRNFSEGYLLFITNKGVAKRSQTGLYSHIRKSGINAIILRDQDSLVDVLKTTGNDKIVLLSKKGSSIIFHEDQIRDSGRMSSGVRGMRVRKGDIVVSCSIVSNEFLLFLTSRGYGKLVKSLDFKAQNRGGKGLIAMKINEKTGELVEVYSANKDQDLVITTKNGKSIRTHVAGISTQSRYAKGVRVIKLDSQDSIASSTLMDHQEELPVEQTQDPNSPEETNKEEIDNQESATDSEENQELKEEKDE